MAEKKWKVLLKNGRELEVTAKEFDVLTTGVIRLLSQSGAAIAVFPIDQVQYIGSTEQVKEI